MLYLIFYCYLTLFFFSLCLYVVHIWEYKGYPGHESTMERLSKDPVSLFNQVKKKKILIVIHKVYAQFLKDLRPLLISRENNMMLEFSFWKTAPPQTTNGIYELRKYNLKVTI